MKKLSSIDGHVALLRQNLLKTINYCLLFSLVGMSDASLGAVLPALACLSGTSQQRIALLLLFHELAVLTVTLIAGCANRRDCLSSNTRRDRLCINLILTSVSLLMPCCFLLVPECHSLASLALAFGAMGLLEGCLEFVCNTQMMSLYRRHSGPFLQAMFFCQSLGAFVAPLIIGSFLTRPQPHEWLNCSKPDGAAGTLGLISSSGVMMNSSASYLEKILPWVRYPFWVIAAIQAPMVMLMVALTYKEATVGVVSQAEVLAEDNEDSTEIAEDVFEKNKNAKTYWIILLVASVCAFCLDGILGSFSGLIFSFSMRSVRTPHDRGETAYLPATFWGFTLFGRLSGIFLSLKLSSACLLIIDLVGLTVSSAVLLLWQHNIGMLFVATLSTGFFISHCMPALLALTEQLVMVTKDSALCLISSAALGEAILPIVMAAAMHKSGNGAYPIGHCLLVIGSAVVSCAYMYIGVGRTSNQGCCSSISNSTPLTGTGEAANHRQVDNEKAAVVETPLSSDLRPELSGQRPVDYGSHSQSLPTTATADQ